MSLITNQSRESTGKRLTSFILRFWKYTISFWGTIEFQCKYNFIIDKKKPFYNLMFKSYILKIEQEAGYRRCLLCYLTDCKENVLN